MPAKSLS